MGLTLVQINTFSYKSTGHIMMNLHKLMQSQDITSYVVWARGRKEQSGYEINMGSNFGIKWHGLYTRVTDKAGFASVRETKHLIDKLKEIKPDIVHLHNIHGYYINIELLFSYLKESNVRVIWTLHDCWSFTGHCAYFDFIGCSKWKSGCYSCPQKSTYPATKVLDNSRWNWNKKRELFGSIKDMTIVTPSKWLADLVEKSFLGKYPIKTIYNGIDLDSFRPIYNDVRTRYGLENKIIILGVASTWETRKGLDSFIELSKKLDKRYKIILVGLTKEQIQKVSSNIIAIERTNNIDELVALYSVADLYVNTSIEETLGLTTVEALACGTPVVVFDATAIPETVDSSCGFVVEKNNIDEMVKMINVAVQSNISKEVCRKRAMKFEKSSRFNEYIQLYREMCEA
jgi:glycosyltransferase involved in cell wall biosynthesis